MFRLTYKKYVYIITLLLLIFIILAPLSTYLYLTFYSDNRIYSIRKVSEEYRVSLVNNFINNNYKENSILLLGDSQPNGHLYPTKYIYSTLLENKLTKNVLNLAFQDSRILDNIYMLEYLHKRNMKFESIIFNVNASHIKANDFTRLKENGLIPKEFFIGIFKQLSSFIKLIMYPNPQLKPNEQIDFRNHGNDYFEIKEEKLKEYFYKLEIFIDLAKNISNNVIIYETPHSLNAIKYNNKDDIAILEKFSNSFSEFCKNKNIKCINIDILEDDYYIDIVHFNSKGHEKMSTILYDILK